MAAAMIKDGETASGPPPRSRRGGSGPWKLILPVTQTRTVVLFSRFPLITSIASLPTGHFCLFWRSEAFFFLLLWVLELSANILNK